jgi:hypothetical protein
MPKKTLFVTAIIATALGLGGSLAFATPAFASPTPATGPVTTVSNLVVGVDNTAGRQVQIQFNYTVADPTLDGDSIVEVTDFDSCSTPTVIDRDVPLPNAIGGGISLFVAVPAAGFVKVQVFSSNGASAPLVTAPAFATDATVDAGDFGASITPGVPPTTGSIVISPGNEVPVTHLQLYLDGVASGPVISVDGCNVEDVEDYSVAAGTVLTLHEIDGDFDAATFTVPPAASAPTDPTIRRLPTTGVGPGSWSAGGFGLVAVFIGGLLLLVQRRTRRRGASAPR